MPIHLAALAIGGALLGGGMMLGSSLINARSTEKQMEMMLAANREQNQQFNQMWGSQLQQGSQNMGLWQNIAMGQTGGAGQFGQAPGGYFPPQFGPRG
ncbi:MAG: hypothetical protein HY319_17360 [Armatimonadetes bacterium]|nr:hypothetical protein [Armatimonadota bacterium]